MLESKMKEGQEIYSLAGGWSWYDIRAEKWNSPLLGQLRTRYPATERWLDMAPSVMDRNYLSVRFGDGINPIIAGTFLYRVTSDFEDKRDTKQVYFYVDKEVFITINLDEDTRRTMLAADCISMLHQCRRPIDGMCVLSRAILHYFHAGMDQFEMNLRSVENDMRTRNRRTLMDQILTARYELLDWSNLFIPYQEFITAAREGYDDELNNSRPFKQLLYRVERTEKLIRHYEREIEALVSIDDAISGFRGNEIMKTLTIMTVIFTPATVAGAIWGMNFENLPVIHVGWGFAAVMFFTLLCTVGTYLWMQAKGWTGDLLKVKSKDKNI